MIDKAEMVMLRFLSSAIVVLNLSSFFAGLPGEVFLNSDYTEYIQILVLFLQFMLNDSASPRKIKK